MNEELITITLTREQARLIIESLDTYCYTVCSAISYDEAQELNINKNTILDMIQKEYIKGE